MTCCEVVTDLIEIIKISYVCNFLHAFTYMKIALFSYPTILWLMLMPLKYCNGLCAASFDLIMALPTQVSRIYIFFLIFNANSESFLQCVR